MKKFSFDLADGRQGEVTIPDNCQHPFIHPRSKCYAVHPSQPECDCRWCVFNKEFAQANQREV